MDDLKRDAILGAIVGATLGAPFAGRTDYHKLNFYEPIPVRMAPSEALDAWLVWNAHVRQDLAPELLCRSLMQSWTYRSQETAFAQANLEREFAAPLCGSFQNPIASGSRALGRAIYWGIVFHGDPERAAEYAAFDACIDHSGEGVSCAVGLAFAMAATSRGDSPTRVARIAASALPLDSPALRLLNVAIRCVANSDSPQAARDAILNAIDHQDQFDASLNFGYVLLAILLGNGEFGASIKIAASMGGAADQTTMAVGAVTAAMSTLESEWIEPLGDEYVGGHGLRGIEPPKTIEEFICDLPSYDKAVEAVPEVLELPQAIPSAEEDAIGQQATAEPSAAVQAEDATPPVPEPEPPPLPAFPPSVKSLLLSTASKAITHCLGLRVSVEYIEEPIAFPGHNRQLVLTITNQDSEGIVIEPSLEVPAGWSVAHKLASFRLRTGESSSFPIVVQPAKELPDAASLVLKLELNGRVISIPFLAPHKWFWVGPFENIEGTGFDKSYRAQDVLKTGEVFNGRSNQPVKWTEWLQGGVLFDLEPFFKSGPGVIFLAAKATFPKVGPYRVVCAASTGAIVYVNRKKLIWYHDTHIPVPRAILPYTAEFQADGETEVLIKVLRNKEPVLPLVVYFVGEDGSIVSPLRFASIG